MLKGGHEIGVHEMRTRGEKNDMRLSTQAWLQTITKENPEEYFATYYIEATMDAIFSNASSSFITYCSAPF